VCYMNPICPPPRGKECLCGQTANTASECADIHVEIQVWDSIDSATSYEQQTVQCSTKNLNSDHSHLPSYCSAFFIL